MARITVEDCLDHVDNRFELVVVGSKRARQLAVEGHEPLVEVENDKPTVIALREIEKGLVTREILDQPSQQDLNMELESALEEAIKAETAQMAEVAEEMPVIAEEEATPDQPEATDEE